MKRIVAFFVSIIILFSNIIPVTASNDTDIYGVIKAEFSDNKGITEEISVMIQGDHVYANAEELGKRLGYQVKDTNNECITIFNTEKNDLPYCITQFYYESTKVNHMLFSQMVDSYEAPFASVKNDMGLWIPFEYSLLILNSSMLILDDTALIDMPEKKIVDLFLDIMWNHNIYSFDWSKDFGYSDLDWNIIGTFSHIVNLFNGLLKFDGYSWLQLFQTITLSPAAFDDRYGKDISMLFCTESSKELEAIIDEVDSLYNAFTENGEFGKKLKSYSDALDYNVGTLYDISEQIFDNIKNGNSSYAVYNQSYQAFENVLDKQTWFSHTGGNIIEIQKGISKAVPYVDIALKVGEVVKYGEEFGKQDEFSIRALTRYLDSTTNGSTVSQQTKKAMKDYKDSLQKSLIEYSAKRIFDENVANWIKEGAEYTFGDLLGLEANAILIAWNLASNFIPFISSGLSSADKFELALYSYCLQSDAFSIYQDFRNQTFSNVENVTTDNLYRLSQDCYVYLKSCYITRDAALGSLEGKFEAGMNREDVQPLLDYQNEINKDIAKHLTTLKDAKETNEKQIYGFLPDDNKIYLQNYSDDKLIGIIKNVGTLDISNNIFNQYLSELYRYGIRQFDINNYNIEDLIDFIYYIIEYEGLGKADVYNEEAGYISVDEQTVNNILSKYFGLASPKQTIGDNIYDSNKYYFLMGNLGYTFFEVSGDLLIVDNIEMNNGIYNVDFNILHIYNSNETEEINPITNWETYYQYDMDDVKKDKFCEIIGSGSAVFVQRENELNLISLNSSDTKEIKNQLDGHWLSHHESFAEYADLRIQEDNNYVKLGVRSITVEGTYYVRDDGALMVTDLTGEIYNNAEVSYSPYEEDGYLEIFYHQETETLTCKFYFTSDELITEYTLFREYD